MPIDSETVPPIATVRDPLMSLWQSAVAHMIREEALQTNPDADTATLSHIVRDHPFMRAASAHVTAKAEGVSIYDADHIVERFGTSREMMEASQAAFEEVKAKHTGSDKPPVRKYSTADTEGWAQCEAYWVEYYIGHSEPEYRDWKIEGKGNIDYSLIEYRLSADAKVAVIGDWGTGMPDAIALFEAAMAMNPDAIIHLGDIYYSGTKEECKLHIYDVVKAAYEKAGKKIPFFSIPGNHEYYCGGVGFYDLLDKMPDLQPSPRCNQPASYFCLRTVDDAFQFLGMDTGVNDQSPVIDLIDPAGPSLRDSEIEWHRNKLDTFKGSTILLSHHQVFSSNAKINAWPHGTAYLNDHLYSTFDRYFNKVVGWLWGHEHNLALYANDTFGLSMGRLIGCSAYEETEEEDPYTIHYPEIPYLPGDWRLKVRDQYYDHGFAMVQLRSGQMPTITYYNFPSWGDYDPPVEKPEAKELFNESFRKPSEFTKWDWTTPLPHGSNIVNTLAHSGSAYFATNGYVYSLSPSNGTILKTNELGGRGRHEVRLAYFQSSAGWSHLAIGTDGYALGLDATTLGTRWETSLPGCGFHVTSVVTDDKFIYAGCNGYAYQLNAASGNVNHKNSLSGVGKHEVRMVVSGGALFIGTNGYALSLAKESFETNWKVSLKGCGFHVTSVVVEGQYLYVGCNGYIYKLNQSNGNVERTNKLSSRSECRLAVMNGVLYVGTDGYVIGLNTSDLSQRFSASLPGCGYHEVSVLAGNGQVFAGCNGYLYRLAPGTGTVLYDDSLYDLGNHELRLSQEGTMLLVGTDAHALRFTATGTSFSEESPKETPEAATV